ncbi:MAG: hypothetical protein K6G01_11110 [Eubacterium sp.]|nr:hypothetical protein [Eubacterium sp.]
MSKQMIYLRYHSGKWIYQIPMQVDDQKEEQRREELWKRIVEKIWNRKRGRED